VGTASPAARLHVVDTASPAVLRVQSSAASGAARMELWSGPQGGSGIEWRPGYIESFDLGSLTGGLSFWTNVAGNPTGSVEAMRLVNGKVGLGVGSNPQFRLDVGDRIRLRQGSSGSAGLWLFHNTTPAADRAFIGMNGHDLVGMWGNMGAGWSLNMNVITGNLGVGTASPATRLHVIDTASPAVLRVQSTAGFGAARMELWSDPQGSVSEWRPGYIESFDLGDFTGGLSFVTNGTTHQNRQGSVEAMRLVNGRVGLGVAGPGFRLDVNDRIRLRSPAGSTAGLWLYQNGFPTDRAFIGMNGDDLVGMYGLPGAGWSLNMDVTSGHVGIRTNPVPGSALYVNGNALVLGRMRDGRAHQVKSHVDAIQITSTSTIPSWNSNLLGLNLTVFSPSNGTWFLIRFRMNGVQAKGFNTIQGEFRLMVDGQPRDYALEEWHNNGSELRGVSLEWMTPLTYGNHVVVVEWSVRSPSFFTAVTLYGCWGGATRSLTAIEL
jgi:hypothetical protein